LDLVDWAMAWRVAEWVMVLARDAAGETQRPIVEHTPGCREGGGRIPNIINGSPMLQFHPMGGKQATGMHLFPGRIEIRTTTNIREVLSMGGYRWMYQMTGLPGWMRLGFSPGWWGVTPMGMPPGATYLMTGSWPTPQANAYWQGIQSGAVPFGMSGFTANPLGAFSPTVTKEQQLQFLKSQAELIKNQLEAINQQIESLEKETK